MPLFYAYLKEVQNDLYSRFLVTFADRETADEWWRMISTPPSPYAAHVKRVSPQFYFQDDIAHNHVTHFFQRAGLPDAPQFLQKMFFTLLNDRDARILSIAPPIKITDHISDRWYTIRSKGDAQRYWYCRTGDECLVCEEPNCDVIHVSTKHRTKFYVQVRNLLIRDFQAPKDFVMIGTDEISIAPSREYTLCVNDAGALRVTKAHQVAGRGLLFLFDDLKNRFTSHAKKQASGEVVEYIKPAVERGSGETWELAEN